MARTKVHGKPATYARKLMWRAYGITAVFWAVAAGALYLTTQEVIPMVWGVGVAFVAGAVGAGFGSRGSKARIGVVSEKRALRALRKSKVGHIVCGAMLGSGGDIDLIAVGPQLVAIEVKTGHGTVWVNRDGSVRAGRRQLKGKPVGQAKRGAAAVRRHTGVPAAAIVCIADMDQAPLRLNEQDGTMWVCSARDLPNVVDSLTGQLSGEQADQVASQLADTSD